MCDDDKTEKEEVTPSLKQPQKACDNPTNDTPCKKICDQEYKLLKEEVSSEVSKRYHNTLVLTITILTLAAAIIGVFGGQVYLHIIDSKLDSKIEDVIVDKVDIKEIEKNIQGAVLDDINVTQISDAVRSSVLVEAGKQIKRQIDDYSEEMRNRIDNLYLQIGKKEKEIENFDSTINRLSDFIASQTPPQATDNFVLGGRTPSPPKWFFYAQYYGTSSRFSERHFRVPEHKRTFPEIGDKLICVEHRCSEFSTKPKTISVRGRSSFELGKNTGSIKTGEIGIVKDIYNFVDRGGNREVWVDLDF
ncbi:hypothetical protein OAN24_03300 [Pseudodesulfovibrio sp.]|nr:hypothetical protein [Pseudodesulfovibrio sp.]